METCAAECVEWLGFREAKHGANALPHDPQIGFAGEIVRANRGSLERIGGAQRDFSPAFRSNECGREAECMLFDLFEAMIDVINGAEEDLQVGSGRIIACVYKNSR